LRVRDIPFRDDISDFALFFAKIASLFCKLKSAIRSFPSRYADLFTLLVFAGFALNCRF
jgi:hypothetical protein